MVLKDNETKFDLLNKEVAFTGQDELLRPHLGEVFRKLSQYKESRVEEGPLMQDQLCGF